MIPFATSGGYQNHSMTLGRTVDMRDLLVCYGHAGFFCVRGTGKTTMWTEALQGPAIASLA